MWTGRIAACLISLALVVAMPATSHAQTHVKPASADQTHV
jgi:hypothetical protein